MNINFTLVAQVFNKSDKLWLILRERQNIPAETPVNIHQTARCHIPKNITVYTLLTI